MHYASKSTGSISSFHSIKCGVVMSEILDNERFVFAKDGGKDECYTFVC